LFFPFDVFDYVTAHSPQFPRILDGEQMDMEMSGKVSGILMIFFWIIQIFPGFFVLSFS
jgi:hypothetical protein